LVAACGFLSFLDLRLPESAWGRGQKEIYPLKSPPFPLKNGLHLAAFWSILNHEVI
jgi:hypothetical protein